MIKTIESAKESAGKGIARAASGAGRDWVDTAYAALLDYSAKHNRFMTEDVRINCKSVPPTKDARAWGAVTARAIRERLIERVGYYPSKTGNARPMPMWKRVGT